MSRLVDVSSGALCNSLARFASLLAFWVILAGVKPGDLLVGAFAAALATWISFRLLPPGQWSFRPIALTVSILRFFHQSIRAGIDVARHALDPRLPLRPGLVIYRPHLPPGPTRNAFCTFMSLVPGTLPCGSEPGGGVVIHCLNVDDPVLEQLAREETLFVRALGGAVDDV
jgi:multicomponent Na+:H+ antiporter subunit E